MKKYILTIITVLTLSVGFSQEKSSPIVEKTFKVDGVCGECKARIESAALRTKGVKTANWDKKTKDLTVIYNSKKVKLETIQGAVAGKGHETPLIPADSVSYTNLPGCCKYKDGAKCSD